MIHKWPDLQQKFLLKNLSWRCKDQMRYNAQSKPHCCRYWGAERFTGREVRRDSSIRKSEKDERREIFFSKKAEASVWWETERKEPTQRERLKLRRRKKEWTKTEGQSLKRSWKWDCIFSSKMRKQSVELSRIKYKSEEVERNFKTRGKYQKSYCREWIKLKITTDPRAQLELKSKQSQ